MTQDIPTVKNEKKRKKKKDEEKGKYTISIIHMSQYTKFYSKFSQIGLSYNLV